MKTRLAILTFSLCISAYFLLWKKKTPELPEPPSLSVAEYGTPQGGVVAVTSLDTKPVNVTFSYQGYDYTLPEEQISKVIDADFATSQTADYLGEDGYPVVSLNVRVPPQPEPYLIKVERIFVFREHGIYERQYDSRTFDSQRAKDFIQAARERKNK